jgi:hypothetical protein
MGNRGGLWGFTCRTCAVFYADSDFDDGDLGLGNANYDPADDNDNDDDSDCKKSPPHSAKPKGFTLTYQYISMLQIQ